MSVIYTLQTHCKCVVTPVRSYCVTAAKYADTAVTIAVISYTNRPASAEIT